jgi:hypothetical protein
MFVFLPLCDRLVGLTTAGDPCRARKTRCDIATQSVCSECLKRDQASSCQTRDKARPNRFVRPNRIRTALNPDLLSADPQAPAPESPQQDEGRGEAAQVAVGGGLCGEGEIREPSDRLCSSWSVPTRLFSSASAGRPLWTLSTNSPSLSVHQTCLRATDSREHTGG